MRIEQNQIHHQFAMAGEKVNKSQTLDSIRFAVQLMFDAFSKFSEASGSETESIDREES